MAKLQEPVLSDEKKAVIQNFMRYLDNGDIDGSGVGDSSFIVNTPIPKMIVEEYRENRKHYDLDYPGGIEQLVADYEAGKFGE